MSEWKPIDSAPKDGTSVLLHDVWCQHGPNAYYVGAYTSMGNLGMRWCAQGYAKKPTHWMPLQKLTDRDRHPGDPPRSDKPMGHC